MNIIVFGAAFDPPHLGHQAIIRVLLERKLADQVWLLPVRQHAFNKKLSAQAHRLKMTYFLAESLADLENRVKVKTFELDSPNPSFTYRTLTTFRESCPEHHFSFVIGADNLQDFHRWDHYQELIQEFPFFVYPRTGFDLSPLLLGMTVLTKVEPINISSTLIRQKMATGQVIKTLVPQSIADYIVANHLY